MIKFIFSIYMEIAKKKEVTPEGTADQNVFDINKESQLISLLKLGKMKDDEL